MTRYKVALDYVKHRIWKRPYGLWVHEEKGRGDPIILLHGIGADSAAWQSLMTKLTAQKYHVIAVDLLGFGKSPKPRADWNHYTVQEQVREVIHVLKLRHCTRRLRIVGHSMGCLVGIELARRLGAHVEQLVLFQPPFFKDLPSNKRYQTRRDFYNRLYRRMTKGPADNRDFSLIQKVVAKVLQFRLSPETWIPFVRSIHNTILHQTALRDLRRLTVPTKIIYGKLDGFVIGDKHNVFFDTVATHVTSSEITALHRISPKAARAIMTALEIDTSSPDTIQPAV